MIFMMYIEQAFCLQDAEVIQVMASRFRYEVESVHIIS